MKKFGIIILIITGIALSFYVYATPYLALLDLKDGIENQNEQVIADAVDFPAVRDSIKSQMHTKVENEAGKNIFATAGSLLAKGTVEPIIDKAVTPEGIINIMKYGQLPDLNGDNDSKKTPQEVDIEKILKQLGENTRYETLNRFQIIIEEDGKKISLILKRENILSAWKVVDVEGLLEGLL